MRKNLSLTADKSYRNFQIDYSVVSSKRKNYDTDRETTLLTIPEEIICNKGILGYIRGGMITNSRALQLYGVFPLSFAATKTKGLGSFIMSQTLLKFYKDSFSSPEIDPDTNILVRTKAPELISILRNRGFEDTFEDTFLASIQDAGEKSEQILSKRGWL